MGDANADEETDADGETVSSGLKEAQELLDADADPLEESEGVADCEATGVSDAWGELVGSGVCDIAGEAEADEDEL